MLQLQVQSGFSTFLSTDITPKKSMNQGLNSNKKPSLQSITRI